MEQTISNMELILKKVDKELLNNAANEVSTLTHTYGNLVNQVRWNFSFEELLAKIETIKNHQTTFYKIINKVHILIEKSLNNSDYKRADKWSLVLERVSNNINELETLINSIGSVINRKR